MTESHHESARPHERGNECLQRRACDNAVAAHASKSAPLPPDQTKVCKHKSDKQEQMRLSQCHLCNSSTRRCLDGTVAQKQVSYVASCQQQKLRRQRPCKFLCPKPSAPVKIKQSNGAAATDHVQEIAGQAQGKDSFAWGKHWYPLILEGDLDTSAPSAHTLLNIKMVIWQDGQGKWGASEDKCPHRLAPLSEGRIQDGHLACNYHGWCFDRQGNCLENPQSGQSANDPACKSEAARARAFPTQVAQGMLWVWPESGPHAWLESAMQSPVVVPEGDDPSWQGSDEMYFVSSMPVNWDIMMENTMDPSHANWLHDGFVGKWEDSVPMRMRVTHAPSDPNQGFTIEHDGYSKPQKAFGLKVTRNWMPPCTCRFVYEFGNGMVIVFPIYFTPVAPGKSRAFFKAVVKNSPAKPSLKQRLMARLPAGISHASGATMADQDAIMLHGQDHALRAERRHWRGYFAPSSADKGVVAFRRWLHEKAGGDVGWAGGASSSDLGPKLSRQQLRSQWHRHTKECSACKQVLAYIDQARAGLSIVSGGLLLLALFTTAQYRSAITDSTLVELGLGASALLGREALRQFSQRFYESTDPVYNFRKRS